MEELTFLLHRTARATSHRFGAAIADLGLTQRQASALWTIVRRPGISLSGLAQELDADHPTASAVVERLITEALVQRETNLQDRRRASFFATPKALELAERVGAATRATEATLTEAIGAEGCASLRDLLSTLCDRLTGEAPQFSGREHST